MLIRLAFGAGGDDEGFFELGHGGPADFFDGVTKATGAEAAIVEFTKADAEGGDGVASAGTGVWRGFGRVVNTKHLRNFKLQNPNFRENSNSKLQGRRVVSLVGDRWRHDKCGERPFAASKYWRESYFKPGGKQKRVAAGPGKLIRNSSRACCPRQKSGNSVVWCGKNPGFAKVFTCCAWGRARSPVHG